MRIGSGPDLMQFAVHLFEFDLLDIPGDSLVDGRFL